MKHLELFENFNKKSWSDEAYKQLYKEGNNGKSFNNFDEMFSFIDYYLCLSDASKEWEAAETTKRKHLEEYYDSPPTDDEDWFPMDLQDPEFREHIMRELFRIYNSITFKPKTIGCGNGNCHNRFVQKTIDSSRFCSRRCRDEYDDGMSKGD